MILKPTVADLFRFRPVAGNELDIEAAWARADSDELSGWRSRYIGYVLQHGGLLPYLSVRKNIELPRRLLELPVGDIAGELAARLGIAQQLDKLPAALSVGQRQRVAIARALAHEPPVVIADEPTAAIDPVNAERITRLLARLADELEVTLIVASHAQDLMRETGFTLLTHEIDLVAGDSMAVSVSTEERAAA
jgi:putative ABC transport system ATP-binding protein